MTQPSDTGLTPALLQQAQNNLLQTISTLPFSTAMLTTTVNNSVLNINFHRRFHPTCPYLIVLIYFTLKLQGCSYSRDVFLLEPLNWKFWRLEDQPVEVSYLLALLTYSSLRSVGVLSVQDNC